MNEDTAKNWIAKADVLLPPACRQTGIQKSITDFGTMV